MATQPISGRLTYAEFANLPDEEAGSRRELVDGELYVTPSPSGPHQIVAGDLYRPLCDIISTPTVGIVIQDYDVVLDPDRVVRPDIAVVLPDRLDRYSDRCIQGTPSIVIEVLSPGSEVHDQVRKLYWYEFYGALEYWLVHVSRRRIDVYRRVHPDRFALPPLTLRSGDRLRTPLIPALDLRIDDLYKRLPEPPRKE